MSDYKLDPPVDERAESIHREVSDMTDAELIEEASRRGLLEVDEDDNDVIPKDLEELREKLEDVFYWEDE